MGNPYTDLETSLLAAGARDRDAMASIQVGLDGYDFTDPALAWVFAQMCLAWSNKELLNHRTLTAAVELEPEEHVTILLSAAIQVLFKAKPSQSIQTDIQTLLRRQQGAKLTKGIETAVRYMEHGDNDAAAEALARLAEAKASTVHAETLFAGFGENRRRNGGIHIGIPRFDRETDGIHPTELGLILGTTGLGKSILATNIGYHAWRQHKRVLHIDSENGIDLVKARYIARMTGVRAKAVYHGRLSASETLIVGALALRQKHVDEYLRVMNIGVDTTSLAEVRGEVQRLASGGWAPELIIFDTVDHVVVKRSDNVALDYKRLYEAVKGWCDKDKIPIWATTQAGKEAEGRIATAKTTAWGYDKARCATTIISINPGSDANGKIIPESQLDGQRQLFVAKSRSSKGKFTIPLHTDFARAMIKGINVD